LASFDVNSIHGLVELGKELCSSLCLALRSEPCIFFAEPQCFVQKEDEPSDFLVRRAGCFASANQNKRSIHPGLKLLARLGCYGHYLSREQKQDCRDNAYD
jgi:hypothetical protein